MFFVVVGDNFMGAAAGLFEEPPPAPEVPLAAQAEAEAREQLQQKGENILVTIYSVVCR